jgi:hypothetical protein
VLRGERKRRSNMFGLLSVDDDDDNDDENNNLLMQVS